MSDGRQGLADSVRSSGCGRLTSLWSCSGPRLPSLNGPSAITEGVKRGTNTRTHTHTNYATQLCGDVPTKPEGRFLGWRGPGGGKEPGGGKKPRAPGGGGGGGLLNIGPPGSGNR